MHSAQWPKLLTVLNQLVTERHLQVYMNASTAQNEVRRIGWGGDMMKPSANHETLFEVESNFAADKVNHWLSRKYSLVLTEQSGKLHHQLTVEYINAAPRGYQGGQTYRCYIRLYVPSSATGLSSVGPVPDNVPTDEAHPGFGLVDGWFSMHGLTSGGPGTATMRFSWDSAWDGKSAIQIYWQKQAGTAADPIKVTFISGGKTYSASTDLAQDRLLVLGSSGVAVKAGLAGQAQLPLIGSSS